MFIVSRKMSLFGDSGWMYVYYNVYVRTIALYMKKTFATKTKRDASNVLYMQYSEIEHAYDAK